MPKMSLKSPGNAEIVEGRINISPSILRLKPENFRGINHAIRALFAWSLSILCNIVSPCAGICQSINIPKDHGH